MAKEVKVPQISEGVESAEVAEILVSEGDTIEKEQSIIALETDKASVEVPSSDSGKVKEIKVKEGDEIKVGDVILTLEEEGEEGDEQEEEKEEEEDKEEDKDKEKEKKEEKEEDEEGADEQKADKEAKKEDKEGEKEKEKEKEKADEEEEKDQEKKQEEKAQEKKEEEGKKKEKEEKEAEEEKKEEQAKKDEEKGEKEEKEEKREKAEKEKEGKKEEKEESEEATEEVPASPAVRRLARELDVDLKALDGSGPEGRITEEDVKSQSKKKERGGESGLTQPSLPDFSQWGQVERKGLSNIRKATAKNTVASWQSIPHVTQFDEADVSDIEEYRKKNADKVQEAGGKLTVTAILVKIVANALQQFPKFNASIDVEQEEVILKKYIHIGIAVDTEKGLLVPVIRDVNKKSITEIAVEITALSEKARNQQLSPEDMKGGNFSISNLGGIGGTNFTPIVYHPQVAILGVAQAKTQAVFMNGSFQPRQILPLSLSYDHRLIDGAEGAEFLRWIAQALEDPYKALLGA